MAYRFQKKSGPSKTSVDSYDEDSVTYGGDMSTIYSPPPFEGNMQEAKALFENINQQQKTDSLYQRIDEYKMKNMELQEALRKLQEEFTTEMDDREKIIKHLRTEYKASSTKAADLQAQLDLTIKSANEKYEKMESKLTRKVHDLEEEVLMKEVELSKLKEFAGIKDELEEEGRHAADDFESFQSVHRPNTVSNPVRPAYSAQRRSVASVPGPPAQQEGGRRLRGARKKLEVEKQKSKSVEANNP